MSNAILREAYARIDRNLRAYELKWMAERDARPRDPNDERPARCVLGRCRRHKRCCSDPAAKVPCPVYADIKSRIRS